MNNNYIRKNFSLFLLGLGIKSIFLKKKKGVSLAELIISTVVLSVIMLGTAGFTANFMDASSRHSQQMHNVNQSRSICENISNEISNAAYIYPANTDISLNTYQEGESYTITINTNDAVAMLYEYDNYGYISYGFTAFYLVDNGEGGADLFQFTEYPSHEWTNNTSPASNLLSFYGNSSKIVSDINRSNTFLTYIMNYGNGLTDQVLLGEIGGVDTTDVNALIKGIDWQIAQSNIEDRTIKIKELSRNVPRFEE